MKRCILTILVLIFVSFQGLSFFETQAAVLELEETKDVYTDSSELEKHEPEPSIDVDWRFDNRFESALNQLNTYRNVRVYTYQSDQFSLFSTYTGMSQEYSITNPISSVFGGVIYIYPEVVMNGMYYKTTLRHILSALDLEKNFQTAEVYAGDALVPLALSNTVLDRTIENYLTDTFFIRIIGQDQRLGFVEENYQDYTFVIEEPLNDTNLYLEASQEVVLFDGMTLTVDEGTTVHDLLGVIDRLPYFQNVAVVDNEYEHKPQGELFTFNYLLLQAQNGDLNKFPIVMIPEVVIDPSFYDVSLMSIEGILTEIEDLTITVVAGTTWQELVAELEAQNPNRTYEMITSSGTPKVRDEIYTYDRLVVLAEDQETEAIYTVIELVDEE